MAALIASSAEAQQPGGAPSLDELQQQIEQKKELQKEADDARAAERRAVSEKRKQEAARAAAETRKALVDAAAATPLNCADTKGGSLVNINFHQGLSYQAASYAADALTMWTLTWNISNTNASGYSGSVEAVLYAVTESGNTDRFRNGGWPGYRIATFLPSFSGTELTRTIN